MFLDDFALSRDFCPTSLTTSRPRVRVDQEAANRIVVHHAGLGRQAKRDNMECGGSASSMSKHELVSRYGRGAEMLQKMGFKAGGPLNVQKGGIAVPLGVSVRPHKEGIQEDERARQRAREKRHAAISAQQGLLAEMEGLQDEEDAALEGSDACLKLAAAVRNVLVCAGPMSIEELAQKPEVASLLHRSPVDTLQKFLERSPSLGCDDALSSRCRRLSEAGSVRVLRVKCNWCRRRFASESELVQHVQTCLGSALQWGGDDEHPFLACLRLIGDKDPACLPGLAQISCPLCSPAFSSLEELMAHWYLTGGPVHGLLLKLTASLLLQARPPSKLCDLEQWVAKGPCDTINSLRMLVALVRPRRLEADAADLSRQALCEVLNERNMEWPESALQSELLEFLFADLRWQDRLEKATSRSNCPAGKPDASVKVTESMASGKHRSSGPTASVDLTVLEETKKRRRTITISDSSDEEDSKFLPPLLPPSPPKLWCSKPPCNDVVS